MRLRARWDLLLVLFACGALTAPVQDRLSAQEARGTIVGRIVDASGGVIPGASVEVLNKAMGTKLALTTNDEGFYQATYLIPGLYTITVELPGFKKAVRDDVELRVNDRLELNITLEVGTPDQVITVTGETPLLNTASASAGQVVDARRVAELPVPHSNPYALIGLAAGVAFTRDPRLDRPFEPTHIVGYTIDGTRANRSDVTIDGVPATSTAGANEVISSYVPPADIVAEFKVQTATFDASFGQTEGGVTNISMKSGTNALHGTAYWSKMAPGLFANDFFANRSGTPKGDFTYNRWGGSAGGPVWFPKLYNGKNRTFFMWGYEGIHESRPRNNGTPSVPTTKMKNGDFSELLALGSNYQIYNPFTRKSVGGGRYQQEKFDGNIIPSNLINPVTKKILGYFPDPLSEGKADKTSNYAQPNLLESIIYWTHSVRIDHVISDKQRLFVRGSVYKRASDYNNYFHNLSTGNWFQFLSRALTIDDVYTINPTTVLNFRYGYNRFVRADDGNPESIGFDLASLGFPSAYNDSIPADTRRFPQINIDGYQGTYSTGYWQPSDTHAIVAALTKQQGAHALKGGMEFRAYRKNYFQYDHTQSGVFSFSTGWTRGPLDNSPAAPGGLGQGMASLLLGLPTGGSVARQANYAEQSLSWGFYFHDDWKAHDRLTLNLGLRWEFESPLTERFDRSVKGFDKGYMQPIEAQVKTIYAKNPTAEVPVDQFNVRGGLTFANVKGESRGVYETNKVNLMPRIGLAYKVADKTVLRAGYGIFFGFLGQRRGDVVQSGFAQNTPFTASNDSGLTFIATLSNPFPTGILEPVGAANGYQTYLGQSVTFFNQTPLMPYMQRWELSLQRELSHGFVAEAAYVGNRGTHIEFSRNLNATPLQYLSTSPTRDQAKIDYLSANVPNPFYDTAAGKTVLPTGAVSGLTGKNISRTRLLAAFPGFDAVNTTDYQGYSWYHSAQLSLQKRFSQGYTLNASYTLSKYMQATELLNGGALLPTEQISDFDRPHRLTVNGIFEFPFGQGKRFGSVVNPVLSRIISGWQVNGIYAYQSGAPLGNWGNIIFTGDLKNVRLPGDQQTVERWFNTDAGFEKSPQKALGSNVRTFPQRFGFLRADNTNNIDLSVIKNTTVAEEMLVQFKAEFINAFNHPLFPGPNLDPTSATFGQINPSTQANYPRRIQISLKFIF
jgi:hypothetical protein